MTTSDAQTDFYQIVDGFLAGEYPYAPSADEGLKKLRGVLDAGATCFVDLTEPGEHDLRPYTAHLLDDAQHVRMPIQDQSVPSRDEMVEILDVIDARLADGETVYVHCWGGIGRTGTVVGCFLMRHGAATPQDVMAQIAALRRRTRKAYRQSPETTEQVRLVTSWQRGE